MFNKNFLLLIAKFNVFLSLPFLSVTVSVNFPVFCPLSSHILKYVGDQWGWQWSSGFCFVFWPLFLSVNVHQSHSPQGIITINCLMIAKILPFNVLWFGYTFTALLWNHFFPFVILLWCIYMHHICTLILRQAYLYT